MISINLRLRSLLESGKLPLAQLTGDYRTLQILGIIMNELQQKTLLTVAVVGSIILGSVSGAVFIQIFKTAASYTKKDVLLALLLSLISGSGMTLVFVVGGLAYINLNSRELLNTTRRVMASKYYARQEYKVLKRVSRSFACIKAMFASLNFIEQSTPLTCIQFSNELMIQFLLVVQ